MNALKLGPSGPDCSILGLGCMGMSDLYGPADRAESIATIHMALEAGITLFDTADFYGMGDNELLLREALAGRRERALLSVKFGAMRDPEGRWIGQDCRPAAVKNFAAYSLKRLGTDHIDIYRPARIDPAVPVEDTVDAIARLVKSGQVRHIGLSEVSAETLRRAHKVHPIADVQIEYSLVSRGIEEQLLPACRELGVAITAYGVLSRGLISGHWSTDRGLSANDFRSFIPRFSGANLEKNLALVETLRAVAAGLGATPAQVAIAWVLERGPGIVPLIGARSRERLRESLGAVNVKLTGADRAALEATFHSHAASGTRYPAQAMAHLDSERRS
jgi:aryl-alcohol dehydrogenase-like predicted oxidoreductase